MKFLIQYQYSPLPQEEQAFILFIIDRELIKEVKLETIPEFKEALLKATDTDAELKAIKKEFAEEKVLNKATATKLEKALKTFIKNFNK